MNKRSQVLMLALLVSILVNIQATSSFVPEQTLVFFQVPDKHETINGTTVEFALFIKNYFNYTITNITVSLNLTESSDLHFLSCSFGELTGDNVTLNSTILSPEIGEFDSVNITYGNMTSSYLEYNVSEIEPDQQMSFFYNITSNAIVETSVPRSSMSYYDNWMDLQEGIETERIGLSFVSGEKDKETYLPYWHIGNSIPTAWGWVIFAGMICLDILF